MNFTILFFIFYRIFLSKHAPKTTKKTVAHSYNVKLLQNHEVLYAVFFRAPNRNNNKKKRNLERKIIHRELVYAIQLSLYIISFSYERRFVRDTRYICRDVIFVQYSLMFAFLLLHHNQDLFLFHSFFCL